MLTKHEMFLFLARNLSLGFQVVESDHGLDPEVIRIRTRNSDFVIDKNGRLACACSSNFIREEIPATNLLGRLEDLRNSHRCNRPL